MAEQSEMPALLQSSAQATRRKQNDLPRFLARLKLNTPPWLREALAEFMGTFILL
ncbi:Hypothetical predicted protein, partial [Paramuricea clavata]